jgi:branched-chain amino acid aminotransferase group I
MKQIVYLNGKLIPITEASIPVTDYGFLFGYGLFETMRSYNGRVFRLEGHLDRLKKTVKMLEIPLDITGLKTAVYDTIEANNLKEARIRLTVSAGTGSPAPDPASCGEPTVLITAWQYVPYPDDIYERGFHTRLSTSRRNSRCRIASMKTLNYMENLIAKREAKTGGFDDVLFLNEKGLVSESSSSNIFLVRDNVLKTPGIESGILPGITRAAVLELAMQQSIKTVEADIPGDEIMSADEAFLTNSVMEIMPLTEIDSKPVGYGKPGAITARLMKNYRELVEKETG